MKTKQKLFQILRGKGLTLEEIGKKQKPPISAERVRQILNPVKLRKCKKHKVFYTISKNTRTGHCRYCLVEDLYSKILDKSTKQQMKWHIERLSRPDRSKETVIQRSLLIKRLRDEFNLSFVKISVLLDRDHSSILNLYYKKL